MMNTDNSMLIAVLAIVILFGLTVLGLALRLQSELLLNQRTAGGLKAASTVCFVIVALMCLAFGNLLGLVLGIIILGRWIHFQLSQHWARQHAEELELIWLLALSLNANRSLVHEVEMYAESTSGPRKQRLLAFAKDLQKGRPLKECLPYELFSRPTALQLQVALGSGTFAESLTRVAISEGRALSERRTGLGYSILAYQGALVVMLIGICSFVMYYIIPKFKKIFDDFGTELPAATIVIIQCSDAVVNYWYLGVLAFIAILVIYWRNPIGGRHHSEAAVVVDLLGRFFVRFHAPEILRALATAIFSKQPIANGVGVFAQQPSPGLVQKTIRTVIDRVQRGEATWEILRELRIIRRSEQNVIEAASRAGNLPWVLETLAENLDRRWAYRFNVYGTILHPVLLLAVSIPIAFFAIAIFWPLIKLLNDLS